MLPVVAGPRATRRQMLLYTLALWPASVAPWLLGVAGVVYGAGALALSALFTASAVRVCIDGSERSAKLMFGFSLLYLFLIFSLLLVDHAGAALAHGGAL
jgi:protoheme IX farnesyltransferase